MNPFTPLVEACLDQSHPSPALVAALNDLLTLMRHDCRLADASERAA